MNCLWRMLRLKCLWVELRTFSRSFNLVSSAIFSLRIQGWGVGGFWIGVGVQHKNLINQNHCDWENFGIKNSLNERCYKVSWSTFQHWHLFLIQILVWRCLDKLDLDEMMRPQSGHLNGVDNFCWYLAKYWGSNDLDWGVLGLLVDGALQPSGQRCPPFLASFHQLLNSRASILHYIRRLVFKYFWV